MKAMAKLKNLRSNRDKHIIFRNISRILDVQVVDIDVEKSTIAFLCPIFPVFERVARELWRSGYPMQSWRLNGSGKESDKKTILDDIAL